MADLDEWVRLKVARLQLDADVYVEYGLGILNDDDSELAERVASVASVFSGAADGLVSDAELAEALDERTMLKDVERLLAAANAQQEAQEAQRRAEQEQRELEAREKQRKEAEAAVDAEKQKALARANMSREELAAREKLISEYGFSVISEYDEDGNLVKVDDKEKKAAAAADSAMATNTNKQRVQQAQSAMRDKLKKEHEKKVAREKDLLEKDKARKDKAKKRTQKREKQRGAG